VTNDWESVPVAPLGWRHRHRMRSFPWRIVAVLWLLGSAGFASSQAFSVALSVAPSPRTTPIVAAAATVDLVSFGSVSLRGRGDVAFTGGSTFGAALLASVREEGVDLYGGGGIGFGAVATSESRETFVAPYYLVGLRAPLAFGVGLVLEARATPRLGSLTFAFGLDVGFRP
jgi:hypothetical protein